MVDLRDLDKALGNMGIELTEKESKILRDNLPVKGEQEITTSQWKVKRLSPDICTICQN